MAGLTDEREIRLTELKKEVTKRGFDRHASLLQNVSELPTDLQSSSVTALSARETIQTVLIFPPQIQRGWHYVPKQALLFTTTGMIHLLASIWPDEEPQITSLKGCDLMYMKVTLLLLYGSLEIVAQGRGEPVRLGMEFNTVDWYCLAPPLRRFLLVTQIALTGKDARVPMKQRTFEKLPLKFSNGLKLHGLLPGEELEELVFQAGTWKRWLYFFRRPNSADTLLLLTSHYMVMIQEEMDIKQGWVISYIPRNNIVGIKNQSYGLWNELAVQLKRENQSVNYKVKLDNHAVDTWRRQWVQHGGAWQDVPGQQA